MPVVAIRTHIPQPRKFFYQPASLVFTMHLANNRWPLFRQQPPGPRKDFHFRALHIALDKIGRAETRSAVIQ